MWIKTKTGHLVNLNHALCIFVKAPTKYQSDYRVYCDMPSSGQVWFGVDTDGNSYILFQGEKSMCEEFLKNTGECLGVF